MILLFLQAFLFFKLQIFEDSIKLQTVFSYARDTLEKKKGRLSSQDAASMTPSSTASNNEEEGEEDEEESEDECKWQKKVSSLFKKS